MSSLPRILQRCKQMKYSWIHKFLVLALSKLRAVQNELFHDKANKRGLVNPTRWKMAKEMKFKIVFFQGDFRSSWLFALDGLKLELNWNYNGLIIKMKLKIVFPGDFRSYGLLCIEWMSNLGHKRKKFVENALWEKNSKFPKKSSKIYFFRLEF